ncbi:hypothetical protein NQ176_g8363 [Zarea fungicola]|uniref:Uncharacterized protein n=1 Tax=Zarea fungicola TaxID=93591 RepID=A0ACC1MSQ0_9HYPO|nr:hypothetical protein NQ176_g8363 [Lecanicillium fungicola]
MSTFRGIVSEFPQLRIDFFRHVPGQPPPLACFLSHIHSDHLAGLDTLRSPFVYCSAATREILLRLERYPCRISYAKGILEARQQTYKHLSKVLKPIPLETPTTLELVPNFVIQVTLFDANHCPGSVMFLIEQNSTAILYTGDLRSEPWFVNSIARHPVLVEYTTGIRTLDKIYLDTSFTEDVPFQTKREGIAELLRKVAKYPSDTIFYFQTWTYGYEDVWVALSKALKSQIHVDEYKMGIYTSLSSKPGDPRFAADSYFDPLAPALTGYTCGNARLPGCLTSNTHVRLHSCEKGNICSVASQPNVVKIQPIVAHLADGTDLVEAGVGGGGNDFQRDAELGYLSPQDLQMLQDVLQNMGEENEGLFKSLVAAAASGRDLRLGLAIESFGDEFTATLETMFATLAQNKKHRSGSSTPQATDLPRVIRFPYSRHSSYSELCQFVNIFKPLDIWPCTENVQYWWENSYSIASFFGEFCSGRTFAYDQMLRALFPQPPENSENSLDSQMSSNVSLDHGIMDKSSSPKQASFSETSEREIQGPTIIDKAHSEAVDEGDSQHSVISQVLDTDSSFRREAYNRTLERLYGSDWDPVSLLSTDGHHSKMEHEL